MNKYSDCHLFKCKKIFAYIHFYLTTHIGLVYIFFILTQIKQLIVIVLDRKLRCQFLYAIVVFRIQSYTLNYKDLKSK